MWQQRKKKVWQKGEESKFRRPGSHSPRHLESLTMKMSVNTAVIWQREDNLAAVIDRATHRRGMWNILRLLQWVHHLLCPLLDLLPPKLISRVPCKRTAMIVSPSPEEEAMRLMPKQVDCTLTLDPSSRQVLVVLAVALIRQLDPSHHLQCRCMELPRAHHLTR